MILNLIGATLVIAFLYGVFRFGRWCYTQPFQVAEKLAYYDQYLKPGKFMTGYFRGLGAFFYWFSIFGAGYFLLTWLLSLLSLDTVMILFDLLILAWLLGSFFVVRKLLRKLDSDRAHETVATAVPSNSAPTLR